MLDALAADGLLAWGEVATGTPNSEALQRNAPELLPALFNESGLLLAHGRLSERGLRRAFATSGRGGVIAETSLRQRPVRDTQVERSSERQHQGLVRGDGSVCPNRVRLRARAACWHPA